MLFDLGTPLWEIALRSAIVYLAILLGLRLFGKRQLGQMSTGDLVMILLIANWGSGCSKAGRRSS